MVAYSLRIPRADFICCQSFDFLKITSRPGDFCKGTKNVLQQLTMIQNKSLTIMISQNTILHTIPDYLVDLADSCLFSVDHDQDIKYAIIAVCK